MAKDKKYGGQFEEGEAAKAIVSLSQVLLAPLDAILKAQVHSARSFINLVLQMGYPHKPYSPGDANSNLGAGAPAAESADNDRMYLMDFKIDNQQPDGKIVTSHLKVPALALVPINTLSIEQASFDVDFKVSHIFHHKQIQDSEKGKTALEGKFTDEKRPWYLVSEPISVRGVIAGKVSDERREEGTEETTIKISVKVTRQSNPAGVEKLLTHLTQLTTVETIKN